MYGKLQALDIYWPVCSISCFQIFDCTNTVGTLDYAPRSICTFAEDTFQSLQAGSRDPQHQILHLCQDAFAAQHTNNVKLLYTYEDNIILECWLYRIPPDLQSCAIWRAVTITRSLSFLITPTWNLELSNQNRKHNSGAFCSKIEPLIHLLYSLLWVLTVQVYAHINPPAQFEAPNHASNTVYLAPHKLISLRKCHPSLTRNGQWDFFYNLAIYLNIKHCCAKHKFSCTARANHDHVNHLARFSVIEQVVVDLTVLIIYWYILHLAHTIDKTNSHMWCGRASA